MRRPPGLWILLSAGVVWLSLQDAYGLRATSLIFGKTTTTTTTTAKSVSEQPEAAEDESATTIADLGGDPNATKPTLTGNPQLDYVWDPNLPKELNGYNLSDYPFYERVPEDIDFKCDGLHDGFYASVAHKCQVYHHCLHDTRYDFLCANYTAFDQKTFICHFASEVDCANSKRFWHRNDALYKTESTTTIKPFVIYTTGPPPSPITPLASVPLPPSGPGVRRPMVGRRRPLRRRRPQFEYYDDEYYDDYYEERLRSTRRRKRPRPRPRPVYDDDYEEEYEDDRYERRGSGGSRREEERRPYDRGLANRRRNKDRIKDEYEDKEVDEGFEDEDIDEGSRRKVNGRKRPDDTADKKYSGTRKRRPSNERTHEYDKPTTRKSQRKPSSNDYGDSLQADDSRSYERPRIKTDQRTKPRDDTRTIIKPVSGTIYDRPRVAPRIKLPVPKSEAEKYAYKPLGEPSTSTVQDEEEYYDDYEEESIPSRNNPRKQQADVRPRNSSRKQIASQPSQRRPDPYDVEDKPRTKNNRNRPKIPIAEEYYDDYEEEEEEMQRPSTVRSSEKRTKFSSATSTTTTTTTTTEAPIGKVDQPIVRLVKRPFLPSRGGNPYAARGLQPVGSKAMQKAPQKPLVEEMPEGNVKIEEGAFDKAPEVFKPSPQVISDDFSPEAETRKPYKSQNFAGPRTTQKPKVPERNPLDINEEDYDVTLNDALNPTLPNLPVRGSPVGFSPGSDYSFAGFQRQRYNSDPQVSPATSQYVYQTQPQRQTYQPQRDHFVQSNTELNGQYSSYRPRQAQQQTEVFYTRF